MTAARVCDVSGYWQVLKVASQCAASKMTLFGDMDPISDAAGTE